MPTFLELGAGQGLIGAGGVIFADAGGGWWIGFPVESEVIMNLGDHREVEESEIAHRVLRSAHTRIQRPEKVLAMVNSMERFRQRLPGIVLRKGIHFFVWIEGYRRD